MSQSRETGPDIRSPTAMAETGTVVAGGSHAAGSCRSRVAVGDAVVGDAVVGGAAPVVAGTVSVVEGFPASTGCRPAGASVISDVEAVLVV